MNLCLNSIKLSTICFGDTCWSFFSFPFPLLLLPLTPLRFWLLLLSLSSPYFSSFFLSLLFLSFPFFVSELAPIPAKYECNQMFKWHCYENVIKCLNGIVECIELPMMFAIRLFSNCLFQSEWGNFARVKSNERRYGSQR